MVVKLFVNFQYMEAIENSFEHLAKGFTVKDRRLLIFTMTMRYIIFLLSLLKWLKSQQTNNFFLIRSIPLKYIHQSSLKYLGSLL